MYSYEIDNFIKEHNYILNPIQTGYIIDVKKSPQIDHIKYDPYQNRYEMWTNDNYYFTFKPVPYDEYCKEVRDLICKGDRIMQKDYYQLYISYLGSYESDLPSENLWDIINRIDGVFQKKEVEKLGFLIVLKSAQGDSPIFRCMGNDYPEFLLFKEQKLSEMTQNQKGKKLIR